MASLGSVIDRASSSSIAIAAKWTVTELTISGTIRASHRARARVSSSPAQPLIRIAFQLHCLM
jgi:hypothetical protein